MRVDAVSSAPAGSASRRGEVVGTEREQLRAGFGAVLRRERLAAGLLQADLATLLSTTNSAVSRLERGRARPTSTMCARLARGLRGDRGEREVLALEVELQKAAGSSLRRMTERSRRRRDRLTVAAAASATVPGGGDPFTDHLLGLLEVSPDGC